jgi:hypothetical protein
MGKAGILPIGYLPLLCIEAKERRSATHRPGFTGARLSSWGVRGERRQAARCGR